MGSAAWEGAKRAAHELGQKVATGALAKSLGYGYSSTHVSLDQDANLDRKGSTWSKVLGAKAIEELPVILSRDAHDSRIHRWLENKVAATAARERGFKVRTAHPSSGPDPYAKEKRALKIKKAVFAEVIPEIVAAGIDGLTLRGDEMIAKRMLRFVAEHLLDGVRDGIARVEKRRGVEFGHRWDKDDRHVAEYLDRLSTGELRGLILELIASPYPASMNQKGFGSGLEAAAEFVGIDLADRHRKAKDARSLKASARTKRRKVLRDKSRGKKATARRRKKASKKA